jgi:dipeptidyl aminopeptidase/acylaminoacyl peptidase
VEEYGFGELARPLFFGKESNTVFVSSNAGRDKACLCRLDLETGKEEVVFGHPEVDVEQASYSRRRGLLEFAIYETDRVSYRFFDDEVKGRFLRIHESLHDSKAKNPELRLCSRSDDESQWVVHAGRPNWRGAYYHVDHRTGALTEIGKVAPWLPDVLGSVTESFKFQSRDGLPIPGYLTFPDTEKRNNLPMVVVPHGGPWSRDSSGFSPEVEFLASRGYAVLRLNYRGSRGYGRRFLEAGYRQWGLAIQDDITDAVLWALQEGVADSRRVAIFGCSFGGYIALCGLAKTPDLFSCGVSYAGISNLLTWLGREPERWGPYGALVPKMIGDPVRDEPRLRAGSPSVLADRIKAPVFIAHGGRDLRASADEAMKFVEILRAKGRRVTCLLIDDEGHGFQKEENRIHFYSQLEDFLREHLRHRAISLEDRD